MKIIDIPQSGSIGNETSSRNSSGQYRRARAKPTNPDTIAQSAARSRFTSMSAAWRGLTQAQMVAWAAFAQSFTINNSLGTAIHLTGAQCYIKVNTTNLLNGDAVVNTPPALPSFQPITVTGLTANGTTQALSIAGTTPATGTKFQIFAAPASSPGVNFQGNYRYLETSSTFTTGSMSILTPYTTKFGAIITGKKYFVKVVQVMA